MEEACFECGAEAECSACHELRSDLEMETKLRRKLGKQLGEALRKIDSLRSLIAGNAYLSQDQRTLLAADFEHILSGE